MELTVEKLENLIRKSWGIDTCYSELIWEDKEQAASAGHCRVVSLIVNDYFGGQILFAQVMGNPEYTHYWNRLPDGTIVDITKDQFTDEAAFTEPVVVSRADVLDNKRIQRTYPTLKRRVEEKLGQGSAK